MYNNYEDYFENIPNLYLEIKPKITQIEKILGIIFLQELQIITDFDGKVIDIVLLLGDIEGFSYKSKSRTLLEIKLFGKLFSFKALYETEIFISNFLSEKFSRGIDQYHGISLLTKEVVCYYGILGGIRPEYDSININFYLNAISRVEKYFYEEQIYDNLKPLGSFFLGFKDSKIYEKKLYFYEITSKYFQNEAKKQLGKLKDLKIKSYLEKFSSLELKDYWIEYISWSGENFDTKEKFYLLEFFLKSKKRKEILKEIDFYLGNLNFLEAYICEIGSQKKLIKTWFLLKDSYLKRKQNGFYDHQLEL
ncbi:hypothetical protein BKN14_02940 [Candidatus Gracilibacteria bacterium HOT-871]|nr:hypothetical protein BKN14_02940 [Candidatus Gracilibacteria bacterium HOT-871]